LFIVGTLPAENSMRATLLPAITAALMLAAVLATTACTSDQQQSTQLPPPVGAYSLGPNTASGQNYSPNAGSASNGASGSSIFLQEGGGPGFGIPR
jgi:outer membrane lipopolysaccharide assembly protein LptE/RlpB